VNDGGRGGRGTGGASRFPQDEESFLSEEEEALLHEEDRQLLSRDDRGVARAEVAGRCANHPEREASAACTECGKGLCSECVYASGGGHSFCRECMDSTRLVDAEPKIIGQVVETEESVAPRTAVLTLVLVLAVVAALVAGLMALGMLL
jgi:hypothetical protein